MAELPIYPERGREAPGYALERRLERSRNAPAAAREEALHRLRVDCAFETLRLTGTGVDEQTVARLAHERKHRGRDFEGDALVLGQLDALELVESTGKLSIARICEVHRLANPPSEGELRTGEIAPRFSNARPSPPRFIRAKLDNLLEWLYTESGRSMFPAERMALWFPRFVEIAPFDRGNFRTAHLLASHFAVAAGYPPLTLRLPDAEAIRTEVERALRFDTGPLVERFTDAMSRSLFVLEKMSEQQGH